MLSGLAGLCVLAALPGCGAKTKNAVLSGKVTFKNAPVTGGTIVLHPQGNAPPVQGTIDTDGKFSFGGVPKGTYTITFDTEGVRKSLAAVQGMKQKPPGYEGRAYVHLPAKYTNPKLSKLTWDIHQGQESKDFDLKP